MKRTDESISFWDLATSRLPEPRTPQDTANANSANTPGTNSVHRTVRLLPAGVIVDGINNQGWIIGHWTDRDGVSHVFLLNAFVPALSDVAVHNNSAPVTLDNISG